MHLDRILRALVKLDHGLDLFFIHHRDVPYDFYAAGKEIVLGRNPIANSHHLSAYKLDVLHHNPLTVLSPLWGKETMHCATIHGDAEHFLPQCFSLVRRLHARWIVPILARRMSRIFSVSQTTTDYVVDNYGVNASRFVQTPNSVDSRFRVLQSNETKGIRKLYADENPFILTVCNFSERKNPWTILRAFRHYCHTEQGQNCRLVVVGAGWDKSPEVISYLKKEKISDRVNLTGFVPTEDIPKLMNLAECLLFPSLYEGFGMPNLEAMACGCPVITSDVFAIPEIVGNAALIMQNKCDDRELAGLITDIRTDSVLRAQLVARGHKRVRQFSWQESAIRLADSYRELARINRERRSAMAP